jgi:hypothetical protein
MSPVAAGVPLIFVALMVGRFYRMDTDDFLEYRGLLGWLAPIVHDAIELSFLFFMTTLAVSGVYLFAYPFLPKQISDKSSNLEITENSNVTQ